MTLSVIKIYIIWLYYMIQDGLKTKPLNVKIVLHNLFITLLLGSKAEAMLLKQSSYIESKM